MEKKITVINMCSYYFELVKNLTAIEKQVQKQSGFLSLFKKIDFVERIRIFEELKDKTDEAYDIFKIKLSNKKGKEEALLLKLEECFDLLINMLDTQIKININLNQKVVDKTHYNFQEYNNNVSFYNMLHKSLENELPKLQSLFSSLIKKKEKDLSIEEIIELAEKGDSDAQYDLGVCYIKGENVIKDDNKAMHWLMKSAEQGNVNAIKVVEKVLTDFNSFLEKNKQ